MAAPTRGCLAVALCLILAALAPSLSAQDLLSRDKFGEQVEDALDEPDRPAQTSFLARGLRVGSSGGAVRGQF